MHLGWDERWLIFRKCDSFFVSIKKKYSKRLFWTWNWKSPPINRIMLWAGILNFKSRIVFWNIFFFWRFGGLKNESHFLKKSHLYQWTVYFLGMLGKLCTWIVGISDLLTYGKNPSEIMDKQSLNQIKIYTPCGDERDFFDGWGG